MYDASSIKILNQEEANNRFEFAYILELMEKYPNRSEQNIKDGVSACIRIGVDPKYFEDYFLKGDSTVKRIPEVEIVFAEIHQENKLK